MTQSPALTPDMLKFIEDIALYYENFGIPRIAGRMFGLFLVTTEPLSAEQVAEALAASLSSVSTNIRVIMANGWVEKITRPGDRTTYYRFSPTAWASVMERRRQGIAPLKALASRLNASLPPDHPAHKQLQGMVEWTDMLMQHYDTLIATWQARQSENQKE
jgi:DNA-binding transcriptional regulator GbsR (MarR family)